jgi:hypothetical protein
MKRRGIALPLALSLFLAGTARAQEDLDGSIKELASKISKDGLSGRLAEAAASDWGVQAIREKIDFLLGARIARFERDPLGYYEDHLFSTDSNGDLRLRAELQDDLQRLAVRMSRAPAARSDFDRRCDELVRKLGDATELDKRAKAAWSDPAFRVAFFHRHPAELRRLTIEDQADLLLLRGLERGRDGKRRVGGPYAEELRERIRTSYASLDALKPYEKAYLQQAAKVKDAAARTALTSDAGVLFVLGRLLRQASEGGPEAIGGINEGDEANNVPASVSFNLELDELVPLLKEAEALAAALKGVFDQTIPDLATVAEAETSLLEFLKNEPVRILLADRLLAAAKEQKTKADEILAAVIEDGFEEKDGRLHVKKGRYVDENKEESVDALNAELNGVLEEFNGSIRQDFDRIAERCLDAPVVALFEDRAATFVLLEHRDYIIASIVDSVRKQALETFVKAYLSKQGETYVVRPERAKRIEGLLQRAAEIKKEMEKAAAEK